MKKIRIFLLIVSCIQSISIISASTTTPGMSFDNRQPPPTIELEDFLLENFELCSFLKIFGEKPKFTTFLSAQKTIFEIFDPHSHIKLAFAHGKFHLNVDDAAKEFSKSIDYEKWFHVCLFRNSSDSEVVVEINFVDAKKSDFYDVDIVNLDEDRFNPLDEIIHTRSEFDYDDVSYDAPITTLRIGSFIGRLKFDVAHLTLKTNVSIESRKNETALSCVDNFKSNDSMDFDRYWTPKINNKLQIDHFEICTDLYVIVPIRQYANYPEHAQTCRMLNGRMLLVEEIAAYEKDLAQSAENLMIRDKKVSKFGTWIYGGNETPQNLDDLCRYSENFTQVFEDNKPCVIEEYYNLCIAPAYSDFIYYGPLLKYDRQYFLKSSQNGFILEGSESSKVEQVENKWFLSSIIHNHVLQLDGALPVGRNEWYDEQEEEKLQKLTFTACHESKFACSNGTCMDKSIRCNGVVECIDGSDEEKCISIQKDIGYRSKNLPPPLKNQSVFQIEYETAIFNLADITSANGEAKIDLFLGFYWHDPRILFWNPLEWAEFDCDKIWTPNIAMADGYPSGFQVNFEAYRTSCQMFSIRRQKHSYIDPYMGTIVPKEEMKIALIFSSLVTLPCRFNLRRYPFGYQHCNITIWPDNALLTGEFELIFSGSEKFREGSVGYQGRTDLGEYFFLDAIHEVVDGKRLMISIKLKNLYDFHLLNSFIPSFLIWIISYATLYFPVTDFNERVMVSITALLVLATLFTQASASSVITPYFKFLDIWYVVLITFVFLIVTFNTFIHKSRTFIEKSVRDEFVTTNGEKENLTEAHKDKMVDLRIREVLKKNVIARVFFAVSFGMFFATYILGALEVVF